MWRISLLFTVGCLLLGCGSSGGGFTGTVTIYSMDTVLAELNITSADIVRTENGAVITVTGDVNIDGLLEATDGPLHLRVDGNLIASGTIRSVHSAPPDPDSDMAFKDQQIGIYIRVTGLIDFAVTVQVTSDGFVVITDDDTQFDRTPRDAYDETDSASDVLDTLVPLPPEDPVFIPQLASADPRPALQGGGPPVNIRGTWPAAGAPAPRGDTPTWLFRFQGNRTLNIGPWMVNAPGAPPGDPDDQTGPGDEGDNANGDMGKPGLNLNIWNNGGPINIVAKTTLNLADGGDGGPATATCATANGGSGGKSGNFRMTAAGGINLQAGLCIVPGKSGNGGAATVNKGAAAGAGCPGGTGDGATANGGSGADNRKRVFVRGNVQGLTNVTIGGVTAGDGGAGTATACDGGPGNPCCAGGPGGTAAASGGSAGDASLNIAAPITNTGGVNGGAGGNATATGGTGGPGGKCAFGMGGMGGMGGTAAATTGSGGDAEALGNAGGAMGGNAGTMANATSGMGGKGGDTVFGTVGMGGPSGGMPTAMSQTPGTPGGSMAATNPVDPGPGPDGMVVPGALILCVPVAPLVAEGLPTMGVLAPGPRPNYPLEDRSGAPLGTGHLNLPVPGVFSQQNPDHIGLQDAAVEIQIVSLSLVSTQPVEIVGLEINTLSGIGIDAANPLRVEALSKGQVVGCIEIPMVIDNQMNPTTPIPIQLDLGPFPGAQGPIDHVRIVVPAGAFVTFLPFYLIDP